jgi:hypothetical protein
MLHYIHMLWASLLHLLHSMYFDNYDNENYSPDINLGYNGQITLIRGSNVFPSLYLFTRLMGLYFNNSIFIRPLRYFYSSGSVTHLLSPASNGFSSPEII